MFNIEVKLLNSKDGVVIDRKKYTAIDYNHMKNLISTLTEFEINMMLSNYSIPSTQIATSITVNGKEVLINQSNNLTAQEEKLSTVILQTVENVTFMINCVRNALKNNVKAETSATTNDIPPQYTEEPTIEEPMEKKLTSEEKLNKLRTLMIVEAEWSPDEYEFYCQCYLEAKDASTPDHVELRKIIEGFVEIF